jgi:MFS transporter, OFA family, oxalate/formate antiporter
VAGILVFVLGCLTFFLSEGASMNGAIVPEKKTGLPVNLIIGTAVGICGGMSVLFMTTLSVFMMPIIQDIGWTRSQVSLLLTSGFLGYALGSPVLGMLIDKLGVRRVLGVGIAAVVLGLLLLSMARLDPLQAAIVTFFIGFLGAATAPSGYVLVLALSTERRLGLVLGLAMLGYGAGVIGAPLVAQQLIAAFDWRGAYLILAGLAAALGGLAMLLGVGRGLAGRSKRKTTGAGVGDGSGISLAAAVRDYRFWIVAFTAMMLATAGFGVTAHIAAIFSDRGLSAQTAAQLAGSLGAGMFVGRVAAAILMDRIFAPLVATGCSILGAIGLYMLFAISVEQTPLLFAASFLVGLLTGSEGDTVPFLARRYFGTRSFGGIFGCFVGFMGIGGIIGPFALGWTFDLTGSYSPALSACIGACGISAVLFLLLGPYRYPANVERGAEASARDKSALLTG